MTFSPAKQRRGPLLTGYAFSVLGDRLAQTALAAFIIAGLLLIVGVVLLIKPDLLKRTPARATTTSPSSSAEPATS